jgi:hypothetical protein
VAELFHCQLGNSGGFSETIDRLVAQGCSAIFRDARASLKDRLEALGLPRIPMSIGSGSSDVIQVPGIPGCFVLRAFGLTPQSDSTPGIALDVLILPVALGGPTQAQISQLLGAQLVPQSWADANLVDEVRGRLGELSPHGRKLSDPKVREVVRLLYDDETRLASRQWVNILRNRSVTRIGLAPLMTAYKDMRLVEKLLDRPDVLEPRFLIACESCGAILSPAFHTEVHATELLAHSDRRCNACMGESLSVSGGWTAREGIVRGIEEGLWLESLVADEFQKVASSVWAGQMAETNELDALAVLNGHVLLAECKDKGFGQNDYYIALTKAQQIGATELFIVTTSEVSTSVVGQIGQRNREVPSPHVSVVSESSAGSLRDKISTRLTELARYDYSEMFSSTGIWNSTQGWTKLFTRYDTRTALNSDVSLSSFGAEEDETD